MRRRGVVRRLRERLVLGPVRAQLEPDEEVLGWGHVLTPDDERHGVIALTNSRCVVQWLARDQEDGALAWDEVRAWHLANHHPGGPVLTVQSPERETAVRLPVTSKARARKASGIVGLVSDLAPNGAHPSAQSSPEDVPLTVQAERRGLRGHTRRVLVTVAGLLLVLLGGLFASPFLPGPGALTVLAGLAILAREYDWARDIYHWFRRTVERFWEWGRARKARRRAARSAEMQDA